MSIHNLNDRPLTLSLFSLLSLFAPLTLAACTVPKVLGGNQSATDGDTDTDTDTTTDTTTDTEDPPICEAGQGGGAGGTLLWSIGGEALSAFSAGVAVNIDDTFVSAGTLPITALDSDVVVERRGVDGALQWSKTYAGSQGLADRALDVAIDGAGQIHVLARETILYVPGDLDQGIAETIDTRLVVLRYDPSGAQLWRWEQTHPPVAEHDQYTPLGALVTVGDGVRVLVEAFDEAPRVIDLDDAGAELATLTIAPPSGLSIAQRRLADDGSVLLAGDLEGPLSQHNLWIGRFDGAGAVAWTDSFGSLDDTPTALIPTPEGDVLLAWSTSDAGGITNQLRRYDPTGVALWTVPVPLIGVDSGVVDGFVRCDGVILLTGASERPPAPESVWGFRRELWVAAYAGDGAALWSTFQALGDVESYAEGTAVVGLSGGDAIVVGSGRDAAENSFPWIGRYSGG